jgi:hypothetical protein
VSICRIRSRARSNSLSFTGACAWGTRQLPVVPDGPFDLEQVERYLLEEHLRCNRSVDFVVASMAPMPSIASIREGTKHLPAGGRCWIGDPAGYEVFQRTYFASTSGTSSTVPGSRVEPRVECQLRLLEAMRAVIDDELVPTVGDAVVAVFPHRGGFRYSCGIEAHTGGEQLIPSGVSTPVQFGQGPAAGSFTQSILAPVDAGVGAIAIYIREARRGALYWPVRTSEPIVFGAPTQLAFAEEISRRYGIRLVAPHPS